jgi:squalene synthase HpnC
MGVGHYENFPVASVLLPRKLRRPIELIYAFARSADDFADERDWKDDVRLAKLSEYTAELDRIESGKEPEMPLFRALGQVIEHYRLPVRLFRDLLSAFAQDVTKRRYADFAEVMNYCRRSADPVGRLLLHLFHKTDPESLARSDRICSSLQLINFLQDVAIDYAKGRIYLPQDELGRFAVTEEEIARGATDGGWRPLMQYQIDRARSMLMEGAPLARALPGRIGLELRMIVMGGRRILDKIEAVDADVFRRRPLLSAMDWGLIFVQAVR